MLAAAGHLAGRSMCLAVHVPEQVLGLLMSICSASEPGTEVCWQLNWRLSLLLLCQRLLQPAWHI